MEYRKQAVHFKDKSIFDSIKRMEDKLMNEIFDKVPIEKYQFVVHCTEAQMKRVVRSVDDRITPDFIKLHPNPESMTFTFSLGSHQVKFIKTIEI